VYFFCLYKYFEETLTASEKETKNTFLTKVPIDVYFEIGVISISVEKQMTHFWSQKSHVLIKKLQQIFENYNLLLIFQIKGVVSAEVWYDTKWPQKMMGSGLAVNWQ
jgi:hypothetical protein